MTTSAIKLRTGKSISQEKAQITSITKRKGKEVNKKVDKQSLKSSFP